MVFSIEIKYSTRKSVKPMWNSNLPKMDGIYFFGCYKLRQLTFFRGEDVLPAKERESILKIWGALDKKKNAWNKEFKNGIKSEEFENSYGSVPILEKLISRQRKLMKCNY